MIDSSLLAQVMASTSVRSDLPRALSSVIGLESKSTDPAATVLIAKLGVPMLRTVASFFGLVPGQRKKEELVAM